MIIVVLYIAAVFAVGMTLSALAAYVAESIGVTISALAVVAVLGVVLFIWVVAFGVWVYDF